MDRKTITCPECLGTGETYEENIKQYNFKYGSCNTCKGKGLVLSEIAEAYEHNLGFIDPYDDEVDGI